MSDFQDIYVKSQNIFSQKQNPEVYTLSSM